MATFKNQDEFNTNTIPSIQACCIQKRAQEIRIGTKIIQPLSAI